MKKVMLTVLAAAVLLCSCGEQPKDVDIDALAQQIVEGVSFDDALAEIDDSMISMLYNIEGYTDAVLYKGSGATAEEVAIFQMAAPTTRKPRLNRRRHISSRRLIPTRATSRKR